MTLTTHVNRLLLWNTPTGSRACRRLGSSDTTLIVRHLMTSSQGDTPLSSYIIGYPVLSDVT